MTAKQGSKARVSVEEVEQRKLDMPDISIRFATDVLRDTLFSTGPDEVEIANSFMRYVEKCLRRDARFQNIRTSELELLLADARRDVLDDIIVQLDNWRRYIVPTFKYEAEERQREDMAQAS